MLFPEEEAPEVESEAIGSDDPDWEIEFYEGISRHSPDYVEVLMQLGNLYTGRGEHRKGLTIDRKLAKLRSDDPIIHYNLACSYSLLGRVEPSLRALRKAVRLGYGDVEHLQTDGDLNNLREDPRFHQLIERLKRRPRARPRP